MNSVISHDFKLGLSFLVANLFSPGGVLLILYLILLMSLFAFSATKWAYEPLDSLSLWPGAWPGGQIRYCWMKEEKVFPFWSLACGWNYDRWGNGQIMESLKLKTISIPFFFLFYLYLIRDEILSIWCSHYINTFFLFSLLPLQFRLSYLWTIETTCSSLDKLFYFCFLWCLFHIFSFSWSCSSFFHTSDKLIYSLKPTLDVTASGFSLKTQCFLGSLYIFCGCIFHTVW